MQLTTPLQLPGLYAASAPPGLGVPAAAWDLAYRCVYVFIVPSASLLSSVCTNVVCSFVTMVKLTTIEPGLELALELREFDPPRRCRLPRQ